MRKTLTKLLIGSAIIVGGAVISPQHTSYAGMTGSTTSGSR